MTTLNEKLTARQGCVVSKRNKRMKTDSQTTSKDVSPSPTPCSVLSYSQFCQEIKREIMRHERKRDKLESQLKAFQKTCKHENTRFQYDPAGGNDSCTICILCDKSV